MNIIPYKGYAQKREHVFVRVCHKNAAQHIRVRAWVGVHMGFGMYPGRVT